MKRESMWVIILALSLAACSKENAGAADSGPSRPDAASASASASAAPSATTAPATAENDPLPSHSDVAKKVRGEINKQNYKSELDKLEKEIDQPE